MATNNISAEHNNAEFFIKVETPRAEMRSVNKTNSGQYIEPPKMTLEWQDLNFTVKTKSKSTTQDKTILRNVSGSAKPGELLVIMGPSGAGKSSLLDCISGRNSQVKGRITVNGKPWTKKMRQFSSYVLQDDLFYGTLTVKEHLIFQAKMRMGKHVTEAEYTARVNFVMEELGLTKCKDSLIGNERIRGISGGERKRLSFATELLTNPSILFVDEPTSGLDSFMAEVVVQQLRQLARDGRTVIATIHQPSSEIFALFDQLYLMSDGAAVYHGKASESVSYFASIGYQCPQFTNPCDYYMRQLAVMDKESDAEGVSRVEHMIKEWETRSKEHAPELAYSLPNTPTGDATASSTSTGDEDKPIASNRRGFFAEIRLLAARNVLRLLRDRMALGAGVIMSLFVSMLVSLLYRNLEINEKAIQNFVGAFFFIVTNQVFSAANPNFILVPLEIPIILREYNNGLYHLLSWYISKNISEIPTQVLLPVIFFIPMYFIVGIGGGIDMYVSLQVMLILVNSSAVGLGYMVSCLVRRVEIAPLVGIVFIMPFLLVGGLVLNSDDIPFYFIWLKYISPIKYGFEGIMKIFWNDVDIIPCNDTLGPCTPITGSQVLSNFSVGSHSALFDGLILLAINFGFRVIGFLALWLNVRQKK